MIILGIETSCDETGAAVIDADNNHVRVKLLSNVISTSLLLHGKTGGIIPESAAREQIKYTIPVIKQALTDAKIKNPMEEIDAIAVTYGPGLIGSLLVGVETAKTLALAWNKPVIPVNHLFGHIYANWIEKLEARRSSLEAISFPALALIVSGGHTDLVVIQQHGTIQWLGGTRDDAAGEALDKIGRLLQLPYPGGVAIEKEAKKGNSKSYHFPRPLIHDKNFDFSFSGLKTAVLREVQKHYPQLLSFHHSSFSKNAIADQTMKLSPGFVSDISYAAQEAIFDVLVTKTIRAAEQYQISSLLLAGGVASNETLREKFKNVIEQKNLSITFCVPERFLCTDNAAMIATAGYYNNLNLPLHQITANPELYFD